MRTRRLKRTETPAIYHLLSRTVAGERLLEGLDQEVLRKQMRQMAGFCGIEILTYCILSNHFHLLVRVPPKKDLTDRELIRRYTILYGQAEAKILARNLDSNRRDDLREGLLRRMHDISYIMKELKMRFTIYYNKNHNRFGTLWAERFKSLLVESSGHRSAVLAVAAYIDLNPVRAGLCADPKEYRFCGYAEAVAGSDEARANIAWLLGRPSWREASREYRMVLYGAGVATDRSRKGGIDLEKCKEIMEAGGALPLHTLVRCRVRFFSDGLALGSAAFVREIHSRLFGKAMRRERIPRIPIDDDDELCLARRKRKIG